MDEHSPFVVTPFDCNGGGGGTKREGGRGVTAEKACTNTSESGGTAVVYLGRQCNTLAHSITCLIYRTSQTHIKHTHTRYEAFLTGGVEGAWGVGVTCYHDTAVA